MALEQKKYRTIGEVSDLLSIPEYVLRFWETKFSQIKPEKINNRRYYSESDIATIQNIKIALYDKGMTIKGAIQFLKGSSSAQDEAVADDIELINLRNSLTDTLLKLRKLC